MCNGPICRAVAASVPASAVDTPLRPPPSQSANSPKPKILTVKYAPSDSPLLRLPREIRDLVLWYTLVEPRKWDKRHVRTCAYYIPDAPAETPPYRIHEIDEAFHWMSPGYTVGSRPICALHGIDDLCLQERCNTTCLRRRGLGILRANKQINAEASPTFWKHLTACFDTADTLVAVLKAIPDQALYKIRKISFMLPQKVSGTNIASEHGDFQLWLQEYDTRSAMFDFFDKMESLEDLELPVDFFDEIRNKFVRFQRLKHLRVTSSETITYISDWPVWRRSILLDVALTKRFDPRSMGSHVCCRWRMFCRHCHEFFQNIVVEGGRLKDLETDSGVFWTEEATRVLERRRPHRSVPEPYTFSVTSRSSAQFQVKVWGLPANDFDSRVRVERAEFLAEIDRRPREHPTVKVIPDVVAFVEKCPVSREDLDSRRRQRYTGPYKNADTLTKRRRSERKRRDVEHAVARRDKYESGGYEVVEEGRQTS